MGMFGVLLSSKSRHYNQIKPYMMMNCTKVLENKFFKMKCFAVVYIFFTSVDGGLRRTPAHLLLYRCVSAPNDAAILVTSCLQCRLVSCIL